MLLGTAIIFGFTFCAMDVANESIKPWGFHAIRLILGGLCLIPVIVISDRRKTQQEKEIEKNYHVKDLLKGGFLCGFVLALGSIMQQIGLVSTSVGKAGFITSCYIILVPILGVFLKKRCSIFVWGSVFIALVGLYLLCMKENFNIDKGDRYVIACALCFTFQILLIDHFAPKCDCVRLARNQFFVAGITCFIGMFIFEEIPMMSQINRAIIPILYTGILSAGLGFTLQNIAQKNFNPTIASLIMSLESVFAAIGGWLIRHQKLSEREIYGCCLMFIAVVLSQVEVKQIKLMAEKIKSCFVWEK